MTKAKPECCVRIGIATAAERRVRTAAEGLDSGSYITPVAPGWAMLWRLDCETDFSVCPR